MYFKRRAKLEIQHNYLIYNNFNFRFGNLTAKNSINFKQLSNNA